MLYELREKLTACESKELNGFMLDEELQSSSSIIPEVTYNNPVNILQFLLVKMTFQTHTHCTSNTSNYSRHCGFRRKKLFDTKSY